MTPIVIGNYNKPKLTEKCIKSIKEHTDDYSIVLVDNGEKHVKKTDGVNHILSDEPWGFTKAYNEGIRYAREMLVGWDYICLLNNDCQVKKNWLEPLLKAIKSEENIAIVTPLFKDPINADSISVPAHSDILGGHIFGIYESKKAIEEVWSVNFTCVLISRKFIDDFGLLDETMHTFCSDIDYSLRAIQAGWKNLVCEESMIWHELNQTVSDEKLFTKEQKAELMKQDQITFINKWTGQFFNTVLERTPLDIKRKTKASVYFLIADPNGGVIKWGEGKIADGPTPGGPIDTQNIRDKYDQIKRMKIDE
jgi:GT2 family glycosyltransferase